MPDGQLDPEVVVDHVAGPVHEHLLDPADALEHLAEGVLLGGWMVRQFFGSAMSVPGSSLPWPTMRERQAGASCSRAVTAATAGLHSGGGRVRAGRGRPTRR